MSITNWSSSDVSAAFSKYQWFKHQCISTIKNTPNMQPQLLWDQLSKSNCDWSLGTFKRSRNYYQLFKNIANTDPNYSIDTIRSGFQDMLAAPTIDDRANEIAGILVYQSSIESILEILDHVTDHPAMPEQLRQFPIGQCVRAMMSMSSCYTKFKDNKTKDSMVHKHILLSSLVTTK